MNGEGEVQLGEGVEKSANDCMKIRTCVCVCVQVHVCACVRLLSVCVCGVCVYVDPQLCS